MTEIELLDKALFSCASIHQPHGLKAFLAAQNLAHLFETFQMDKQRNIWQQTYRLITQSEIEVEGYFAQRVMAPEFSAFRINKVLALGIYPAAYQAIYQWHQSKGFDDIFSHYANLAAKHDEYLSHNITILSAFKHLYPQLDATQIAPFLDRLTEFITATYNLKTVASKKTASKKEPSKITSGLDDKSTSMPYNVKKLLDVCLKQPSFFGHNLITLAWIMRTKVDLSEVQQLELCSNLYQQATNPLDDPDDGLDERLFALSQPSDSAVVFTQSLRAMVFDSCNNLHQVTLADALYYLYQQFPQESARISRVADYYVRVFKT